MQGQGNDGIAVISMPDDMSCRCGEQLPAGERAGFDLVRNEPICLHCIADRRAGRPQVLDRPQLRRLQVAEPGAAASAIGNTGPSGSSVWLAPAPARRRRTVTPRTLTTALVAATAVVLVLGFTVLRGVGYLASATRAADDPTAYAFLRTTSRGQPVTWDPCLTIEIVVNTSAAPAGADTLLAEAVDRINAASGLHLKVIGRTTQAPLPEPSDRDLASGRPGSGRAPVLVAWTTPEVIPRLKGGVAGVASPVWQYASGLDQERYIGGTVKLDGPQIGQILTGPRGHAKARAAVMHELAHLVGLNHVANNSQVMAPNLGATDFGKGDLAGLTRLGSGGCPYDLTPDATSVPSPS